mmetsp:Transcript_1475/g.2285  ORF Transcript_1475/g.2285 Transcript_1475/m.2285 type:complete len:117 (+) Transcript_1475:381-731(+)
MIPMCVMINAIGIEEIKPTGIGGEKEIQKERIGAIGRDLDLGEEEVLRQAAVTVKEGEGNRKGNGNTITEKKTKGSINHRIGKSVAIEVEVGAEAGDNSNFKLHTSILGSQFAPTF